MADARLERTRRAYQIPPHEKFAKFCTTQPFTVDTSEFTSDDMVAAHNAHLSGDLVLEPCRICEAFARMGRTHG
jgi:hypothetical protein